MQGTQVPAAVRAGALSDALRAHVDAVHDLVRRLGCPADDAPALVEASAAEVVDRAGRAPAGPSGLTGLVGSWFAGAITGVVPGPLDGAPTGGSPEQQLLAAGLAARPPAERAALLLSDAYGLPPETVAGALELPPGDALVLLAHARLGLLPDVYAGEQPAVPAHADPAALARLAGGQPEPGPRHLRGCAACTAIVQAQTDVRRLLAGLRLLPLPEPGREAALERLCVRARTVLPGGAAALPAPRLLSPAPMVLSLLLAAVLGVGLGAVLSRPHASAQAQARPLPPVTAPPLTPLPGDVPHSPDPLPSTLVFTYPPTPTRQPSRPPPTTAPPTTSPPPTSPSPGGTLVLTPARGVAGAPIRVNGIGWAPGGQVNLVLLDPAGGPTGSAATATVGPAGRWQATLPAGAAGAAPGTYAVEATEGRYSARAAFVLR